MLCLTSARFNMSGIVLIQGADTDTDTTSVTSGNGRYVVQQDPESGSFIRVWEPIDEDLTTPGVQAKRIPLIARGIITNGIRSVGTTQMEQPSGIFLNVEYITISIPPEVTLTKRDRITDIRDAHGTLIWKEEETDDSATVFNVLGVTPTPDPFGQVVGYTALCQRAENQKHG